jgi:hypothetical protein
MNDKKRDMIIQRILPLLFVCVALFSGCEQAARIRCHDYQVGRYYYDEIKNLKHSSLNDSLVNTFIEFKADSSFFSNITCSLLMDSVGKWDAGACGIETIGLLSFDNSPRRIQFSPRYKGTSEIAIGGMGHGSEKRHYYWYKRE